jgi:hypothetical protein
MWTAYGVAYCDNFRCWFQQDFYLGVRHTCRILNKLIASANRPPDNFGGLDNYQLIDAILMSSLNYLDPKRWDGIFYLSLPEECYLILLSITKPIENKLMTRKVFFQNVKYLLLRNKSEKEVEEMISGLE